MRIDLLTSRKLPELSETLNSAVTSDAPENIPAVPSEINNISEITALTGSKVYADSPKRPFKINRFLLYFCWGVFLLIAIFFLIGEYFDYDFSTGELISIQGELDDYNAILSEERDLHNIHEDVQGRETVVDKISNLYPRHLSILNNLSNSLPSGVWLTWIQSNAKGKVIVKGQSDTFAKVGDYFKHLKEITLFESLKLREIKRQNQAKANYSFTIEIDTGGASLEYVE